ncbi:MAG: cation:proton antiporter [Acidobacteriota bacterium]
MHQRFPLLLSSLLLATAVALPAYGAGEMPGFFTEVVCLLAASAVIAYFCFRLGLVPILGFLFTGVLLNATGLVRNPELVEAMAELGVILLLFTIGIEFSIESLMRIRRLIFFGGGLQVAVTTALVTGILMLLEVGWRASLFTGLLVSLSSTAIVLKLLESRGEARTETGQIGLGMLIFQDLAVVAMVIAVPLLGGTSEESALEQITSLAIAVAIIGVVLLVARRLVPKVLEALARTCSQEVFLLGVIAICLGTALVTGLAGVSLSLGAFLAGLLVSESRFGNQALGEILPLQILFSAVFFVSVGLLLDVGFLMQNLLLVVAVVAAVLLLKGGIVAGTARLLGYSGGTALAAAFLLAQVGEFSFVLERAGREAGLYPAGMETAGGQTFIASTVVLMALTPFLAQAGAALQRRLEHRAETQAGAAMDEAADLAGGGHDHPSADHVLILGYGRSGRWLAHRLHEADVPSLVLTLSPTGASEAEEAGIAVIRADYSKLSVLQEGGMQRAKLVVIADDTLEMAERAASIVRANAPDVPVLVKMVLEEDARAIEEVGAAFTISEDGPSHRALLAEIHSRLGTTPLTTTSTGGAGPPPAPKVELSTEQRRSTICGHVELARAVTPEARDICPECVAAGDRWVHLRLCMSCGFVGCCDSSKNQHARRHAESREHPIIRSLESGEDWAWCFIDEELL